MTCGIYKITNIITNKIYIGSASNIETRGRVHISYLTRNVHFNEHMQSSWNIYGADNFKFEIVEICEKEHIINREQFWIDWTSCTDKHIGYNKCAKAYSRLGVKSSEAAKARMSAARKGRPYTENEKARKGFREGNTHSKGVERSDEHKKALSAFHKGRPRTEETKAKIKAGWARRLEKLNATI